MASFANFITDYFNYMGLAISTKWLGTQWDWCCTDWLNSRFNEIHSVKKKSHTVHWKRVREKKGGNEEKKNYRQALNSNKTLLQFLFYFFFWFNWYFFLIPQIIIACSWIDYYPFYIDPDHRVNLDIYRWNHRQSEKSLKRSV